MLSLEETCLEEKGEWHSEMVRYDERCRIQEEVFGCGRGLAKGIQTEEARVELTVAGLESVEEKTWFRECGREDFMRSLESGV